MIDTNDKFTHYPVTLDIAGKPLCVTYDGKYYRPGICVGLDHEKDVVEILPLAEVEESGKEEEKENKWKDQFIIIPVINPTMPLAVVMIRKCDIIKITQQEGVCKCVITTKTEDIHTELTLKEIYELL